MGSRQSGGRPGLSNTHQTAWSGSYRLKNTPTAHAHSHLPAHRKAIPRRQLGTDRECHPVELNNVVITLLEICVLVSSYLGAGGHVRLGTTDTHRHSIPQGIINECVLI